MHTADTLQPQQHNGGRCLRALPDLDRPDLDMYDSPLRHFERPVLQAQRHPYDLQVPAPLC